MKIHALDQLCKALISKAGKSCAMGRKKEQEWHIDLKRSPSALRGEVKGIHVPNLPQWGIISDLLN